MEEYERWAKAELLDKAMRAELVKIEHDQTDIEDRFYKSLEFGTGGIRGIMGAGTNRINIYTIRKATQGVTAYISKQGEAQKKAGVAIAYDSRHQSADFAREAGLVLAANGITAYVFNEITPTPVLSFAVRKLGASMGIVITASHNPPEYNGYKVYGSDGAQLTGEAANQIIQECSHVGDELAIDSARLETAMEAGLFHWIGEEINEAYQSQLEELSLQPTEINRGFKVVYTPLHGTGLKPVCAILEHRGFDVKVVEEQAIPDSNFSTVSSPNPEEFSAFTLAIELAEKHEADLIMGTDPDADRLGILAKDQDGRFASITGNQLGALLLHYILQERTKKGDLPSNAVMIKTIVTSELGTAVADHFGIETLNTLTGFKYIGEKIKEFEQTHEKTFIFGYEESYGYLIGDFCRDKDAVQTAMLAAEMAAHYHKEGKSLHEVLHDVFEQVGYFQEDLISLTFAGKTGFEKMEGMMNKLRVQPPTALASTPVKKVLDYESSLDGLPPANVLKFILQDESWAAIRPSGTEPKIKVYIGVRDSGLQEARAKLSKIKASIMSLVESE